LFLRIGCAVSLRSLRRESAAALGRSGFARDGLSTLLRLPFRITPKRSQAAGSTRSGVTIILFRLMNAPCVSTWPTVKNCQSSSPAKIDTAGLMFSDCFSSASASEHEGPSSGSSLAGSISCG
jgi:hypothetical protein